MLTKAEDWLLGAMLALAIGAGVAMIYYGQTHQRPERPEVTITVTPDGCVTYQQVWSDHGSSSQQCHRPSGDNVVVYTP